jgi:hypothetical protein
MGTSLLLIALAQMGAEGWLPEQGAKAVFENPDAKAPIVYNQEQAPESAQLHQPERRQSGGARLTGRPERARSLGVRYWIRLLEQEGRSGAPVSAERVFRSGERVQLVVESNSQGHLTLLQIGTDGTASLLYPSPEAGITNSLIPGFREVVLPGPDHFFRFDEQVGQERLFLIFASSRGEIERLGVDARVQRAQLDGMKAQAEQDRGSKNLLIESFAPGGDPATYAVSIAGITILHEIVLTHR